ncbi:hypothetical protein ABES03_07800 [Neobacillus rhizosphaerae]|uniref:hypothetical protein n=1 Tax=Neobacillus rhizosphaerae TaxID=2880965 RepID=UPI003D2989E5
MKKWKVFLSIFVLVLATGGGALYYFLNVKEYKTADTKVEEIVKSDYQIQLPDENSTVDPTRGEENIGQSTNQTGENASAATAVANKTNAVSTSNKPASAVVKPKKLTVADIMAKYQPVFENLEGQADGKLNNLLSYAFSEYQSKKANGEDISYFYFYSKYTGAAKNLEAATDNSFYYIYNALVKELENSGYSAKVAAPIKSHYVSVKSQRRSTLMNQAMSHIN